MWKKGPLPPDTYQWGGVVPIDYEETGFFFADFQGDKVVIHGAAGENAFRVLKPYEVKWYNNCLDTPPT